MIEQRLDEWIGQIFDPKNVESDAPTLIAARVVRSPGVENNGPTTANGNTLRRRLPYVF